MKKLILTVAVVLFAAFAIADTTELGTNDLCGRMCEWGYENCVCQNLGVCGDVDQWDTDILKTTGGARCFDSYVYCLRGCDPYTV